MMRSATKIVPKMIGRNPIPPASSRHAERGLRIPGRDVERTKRVDVAGPVERDIAGGEHRRISYVRQDRTAQSEYRGVSQLNPIRIARPKRPNSGTRNRRWQVRKFLTSKCEFQRGRRILLSPCPDFSIKKAAHATDDCYYLARTCRATLFGLAVCIPFQPSTSSISRIHSPATQDCGICSAKWRRSLGSGHLCC